jgi:hypothetical protein
LWVPAPGSRGQAEGSVTSSRRAGRNT